MVAREAQVDAGGGVGGVGPAGGDDLAAGVEVRAVVAVDVVVAEEGVLPAAEGVVADGDRDRDVDADHAGLDLQLEAAGGAAVAGEDRGAVAVRGGVDEGEALLVGLGAQDAQDRAEDLVAVAVHLGRNVVDQ